MNTSIPSLRSVLVLAAVGLGNSLAFAGGSLGFPDTIDGYPANVGVLILGHSTSAQGAYPAKLMSALNHPSHTADARHYLQFNAVTGGDGGLLWSVISVAPDDSRYHRVTASQGVGESPQPQWCEAADSVRWSCRRGKVEHLLTGVFPASATGTCADVTVSNGCRQPASMSCTWYDRNIPLAQNPVTAVMTPHECWQRMDRRIALVQDTSNRSWPIDDYDQSGDVDAGDHWLSSRILRSRALPCPGSSGVVDGQVDWDCDQTIDADDGELVVYSGWLRQLAEDLLDPLRYGEAALDAVLFSQKPVEMGQCQLWPEAERNTCNGNRHALRTPAQIAATPDRPLDHYYAPTVYWEHRVIETLFGQSGLDVRILAATPANALALWQRSASCYSSGQSGSDWQIAAAVPGRPSSVAADDSEIDGAGGTADNAGCMIADHIHHNDSGGWMMADHWYRALSEPLWDGLPAAVFANGFEP